MSRPGGSVGLTHIFAELTSQDELNVPLGRSARLRYTCLSVCGKYVALGSNSGGTYIFSRDTLKYLQVVFSDTNAVPVDLVSLSPSNNLIGLGLSNGQVTVFEMNIEKRSKPERVRQTLDHSGHGVTVMTWDSTSSRLYVGDDVGKISVISVPSSKTKTLFSAPSQVIALLDSSVYQIQWWKEKLLVSTITHSHLFDTTKHTYSTIGTKPRAGEFGSCFFLEPNSQVPVIYCARPGSRMWEVSFEGKVLNTHQFKQLMAVPPVPVVRSRSEMFDFTNDVPYQGLSTNFLKMFSMGHFIITWSSKGLYMFDPINVKLSMWTQSIKGIKDVSVYRNDIYLFLENTTVRRLTVLPIYQLFTVLASRQRWSLLAQMLLAADQVNFRPAALKRVKRDLLFNIYQGLKMNGREQLLEKVRASMEDVSEGSIDSLGSDLTEDFLDSLELKGYIFLSSGMVVREGLGSDGDGGSRENSTFERYVPPLGELNDETFYQEEGGEEEREGNEDGVKSTSVKEKQADSPQQLSDIVEINNVHQRPMNQDQEEKSCLKENEKDHLEGQTPVSFSKTVKDSAECPDNFKMARNSEVTSQDELEPADEGVANMEDSEYKEKRSEPDALGTSENENRKEEMKQHDYITLNTGAYGNGSSTGNQIENLTNNCEDENSGSDEFRAKIKDVTSGSFNAPLSLTSTHLAGSVFKSPKLQENVNTKEPSTDCVLSGLTECNQDDFQSVIDSAGQEQTADTRVVCNKAQAKETIDNANTTINAQSALGEAHKVLSSFDTPFKKPESNEFNKARKKNGDVLAILSHEDKTELNLRSKENSPSMTELQPTDSLKDEGQGIEKTVTPHTGKGALARFASVPASTGEDDGIIAKPHRHSKKKSRSKKSSSKGKLTRNASVGTETEAFKKREVELDAMSVSTISSVEEEEELAANFYPDIHSSNGEMRETSDKRKNPETVTSSEERRHSETIPPLVDRLAAARSLEDSDDHLRSLSLTSSGEHILAGSLSVLKDGLSSKLKNQTKSFIKSLKETNILTKSTSASKLDILSDQQRPHSELSISPPPYFETPLSPPLSPGRVEEDDKEELLMLDTAPLYSLALEIKRKLLISPNALLNPRESQALLKSWAREIVLAVGHVSLEFQTRRRQMVQNSETKAHLQGNNSTAYVELPQKLKVQPDSQEIVFRGSGTASYDSSPYLKGFEDSTPLDHSNVSISKHSNGNEFPDKLSPESNDFVHSSTSDHFSSINWWSVVHASSPFSIPSKHLELFQWLTTRCWVCGVTGDTMSTLERLNMNREQDGLDADAISLQNMTNFKSDNDDSLESCQSSNQEDVQHKKRTRFVSSEEDVILMIRNLLTPNLSETFMKQKGQTVIPSLLSLLSDALVPPGHFFCGLQDIVSEKKIEEEGLTEGSVSSSSSHLVPASPIMLEKHESAVRNKILVFDRNGNEIDTRARNCNEKNSRAEGLSQTRPQGENLIFEKTVSSDSISTFSSEFNDRNDSGDSLKFRDEKEPLSSPDTHASLSQSCGPCKPSPGQITSVPWWQAEVLRQDADLALFTRLLFFLLDHDSVKIALEENRTKDQSFFFTWVSLLICSEEKGLGDIVSVILADRQTKSAVDYLRSGILPHKSAMMGHLLELFKQAPLMASDFCGELNKIVSPTDLVGMCALTGRPAMVHLMRYFKQAMLDTAAFLRPVRFKHLVKQPEVRHLLLQSQLPGLSGVQNVTTPTSTSSALAAELLNVLPPDWMETILVQVDSEEERENIIWLCSQFRYYRLCVRLLAQAKQWHRLLRWIVQHDDIKLLRSESRDCYPEAYLPRDIREWAFLLSCMRENQCGSGQTSCELEKSGIEMELEQNSPCIPTEVETERSQKVRIKSTSDLRETTTEKGVKLEVFPKEEANLPEKTSEERTEGKINSAGQINCNQMTDPPVVQRNPADLYFAKSSDNKDLYLESKEKAVWEERKGENFFSPNLNRKKADNPRLLTWGNVGYLLLEHLGGAAAINLLVSHMTKEGDDPSQAWSGLGPEFIQACYTSFLWEGQKDQINHEMLERMSVFMWAKKPGFLAPSVHHAFKAEQNLVEKKQGRETDVQRVFGQVKSLSNESLKSEYLGGHWGVSTDLSRRCGVCNLPLKTIMSLSVQGAVVFPCGHAYHRCCMSDPTFCPQLC